MSNDLEFGTDDELLSAYLDGELSPGHRAALEKRLESDPLLALRLERLGRANATLRDAYAPVVSEPLPETLLSLIRTDAVKAGLRQRAAWMALAASVTLAIGALLGYLVASQSTVPEAGLLASTGSVARGSTLHEVLETTPSGSTREISSGLEVVPVLSFAALDGGYCRELAIAGADGSASALACRRDGAWRVEALGFAEGTPRSRDPQAGGFRPAAGASSVIDAAIDERIAGDPLDAAAETALIERGWPPR